MYSTPEKQKNAEVIKVEQVIWKDIVGYDGYYQGSTHGQVRSLNRTVPYKEGTRKIMAQSTDRDGYKHLRLRKQGQEKSFFVHRLVPTAFVHNKRSDENTQINHKDKEYGLYLKLVKVLRILQRSMG